jgi:hypothetical protein
MSLTRRLHSLSIESSKSEIGSGQKSASGEVSTTVAATDRQSAGGFLPVVCAAGMNPAHSWHTMLVRERGFAVGPGMHSFTSEMRVYRY